MYAVLQGEKLWRRSMCQNRTPVARPRRLRMKGHGKKAKKKWCGRAFDEMKCGRLCSDFQNTGITGEGR